MDSLNTYKSNLTSHYLVNLKKVYSVEKYENSLKEKIITTIKKISNFKK